MNEEALMDSMREMHIETANESIDKDLANYVSQMKDAVESCERVVKSDATRSQKIRDLMHKMAWATANANMELLSALRQIDNISSMKS